MMASRSIAALVLFGTLAVPSISQAQVGGWVSANATFLIPATDAIEQVTVFPYRSENLDATVTYFRESKPSFDIGGGVRFGQFGVGVAASRYVDNETADVHIRVPHPSLFNAHATADGTTQNEMEHKETAVHIEARYVANLPNLSVAVFAGPSYFKTTQELIREIYFNESLNLTTLAYTVVVTRTDNSIESQSAWGFNVGTDVAYYFSQTVGVGGLLRFSRGTIDLPNDFQSNANGTLVTQEVKLGGLSLGGGIRLRF
jgi:hypothetical protein